MAGRGILLVGDNFGAGSSREHAPWALTAWGIRAILSTSYADIFRSNSLKNGVLPIVVDPATHARLFEILAADPDAELTVDLAEQGVLLPDGSTIDFEIDSFAKRMILAGTERARLPPVEGTRAQRLGGHSPATDRYAVRGALSNTWSACPGRNATNRRPAHSWAGVLAARHHAEQVSNAPTGRRER